MNGDQDRGAGAAPKRWRTLPPRADLRDTVAVQETPPKPAVITTPEDPLREAVNVGG
ncbi:hypothetical protein [Actinoallomurus rhizosphaericola]|uniref:hypothetical protein n=1 Tax=Actinoallomurus rhizosphaericola TaxID=2952536 RepID=UPI002091361F|nr:hypothetical protein [Actinoallomurus rhizosphaericola]MCO5991845.1 hypothetical protein [Actinoallomurus rhizosphaericola]